MATSIVELITGDRGPQLSNSSGARALSVGTSWNVIRIGMLVSWTDLGSSPGTGPRAWLGALSGTAAANSVLKSTTTNFIGAAMDTGIGWTRNAGPPVYYSGYRTVVIKRVGSTTTTGGALQNPGTFSSDTTVRNIWLVEITKGSPNWTVQSCAPSNATAAQANATLTLLRQALEASTMANAATAAGSGYTSPAAGTIAFDQTAGNIDSVHFAWDRTSYLKNVYAVGYAKLS